MDDFLVHNYSCTIQYTINHKNDRMTEMRTLIDNWKNKKSILKEANCRWCTQNKELSLNKIRGKIKKQQVFSEAKENGFSVLFW